MHEVDGLEGVGSVHRGPGHSLPSPELGSVLFF